MGKYFIIGDVHGCYRTLLKLLHKCPVDHTPVFVGDVVDRGSDSQSVVRMIMRGNMPCVLGNHEDMMRDHFAMPQYYTPGTWQTYGGEKTLNSFGRYIPEDVKLWLNSLPVSLDLGDLLVSHTGHAEHANEHLNCNDRGLLFPADGKFRVFGHTPVDNAVVTDTYANVDTGCVFKDGFLTAMLWPSKEIISVRNCD